MTDIQIKAFKWDNDGDDEENEPSSMPTDRIKSIKFYDVARDAGDNKRYIAREAIIILKDDDEK